MLFSRVLFFAVLAAAIQAAFSYTDGPGTCTATWSAFSPMVSQGNMNSVPVTGFAFNFSTTAYNPGQTVSVTVSHPTYTSYIGFLLYAQNAAGNQVGTFTPVSGVSASPSRATCSVPAAVIGHVNTNAKGTTGSSSQTVYTWTAPATDAGQLTFMGLVLQGSDGTGHYNGAAFTTNLASNATSVAVSSSSSSSSSTGGNAPAPASSSSGGTMAPVSSSTGATPTRAGAASALSTSVVAIIASAIVAVLAMMQ